MIFKKICKIICIKPALPDAMIIGLVFLENVYPFITICSIKLFSASHQSSHSARCLIMILIPLRLFVSDCCADSCRIFSQVLQIWLSIKSLSDFFEGAAWFVDDRDSAPLSPLRESTHGTNFHIKSSEFTINLINIFIRNIENSPI